MTKDVPSEFERDAAYRPFPRFEQWSAKTTIETARWNRYLISLNEHASASRELFRQAQEVAKRAAAIDTGAIENLYEVDRGFTFTVALETAGWEVKLAEKGEIVRPLFEAQLRSYDFVLDLATRSEVITEVAIRRLHEVVCEAQQTYRVETAVGPQQQPLPKGVYKSRANHVRTRKGEYHSYAPVDMTPAEMQRFIDEMRTEAFIGAHPVIQASYAHYCFVVIHPFADGNGRVARALASIFTYRAISMPIVILTDMKEAYLNSLEAADGGDFQAFVDFMHVRVLETIQLIDERLSVSSAPDVESTAEAIKELFITKGGYTELQVDQAGNALMSTIADTFSREIVRISSDLLQGSVSKEMIANRSSSATHRSLIEAGMRVQISLRTAKPASANVGRLYEVSVPKNADSQDDIRIMDSQGKEVFSAPMGEVYPSLSGMLQLRISFFVERVLGQALAELRGKAQQALPR